MIDNKICSCKRGRFQSWEREPIKWQDECRRKAARPHHSGKLGFALSHWRRAPVLDLDAPFSLKVGASQAFFFFFQVELTSRKQAALVGAKPDNLPILLMDFGICVGVA